MILEFFKRFGWSIVLALSTQLSVYGQSVEITKPLEEVPNSSVIAAYSNEFATEIKDYGDAETGDFKFVVIRVNLEGDAAEAKNKITLYCPTQKLVKTYKERPNQMLFLFPYEAKTIFVECGDDCERKQLISGKQLRSNTVYEIKVKYTAKKQNVYTYYEPEIESQWLMFKLEPQNAVVRVNGEIWQSDEEGVATKKLLFGTYNYTVTAKEYHSKSGSVNLGTEKQTVNVTLQPAFGWISVESNAVTKGADVYVDNDLVGQVPISKHKVSSGTHKVEVVQKKYKTYTTQITVTDNTTVPVTPVMQADFAKLTFKVAENAEIWIDEKKIGNGNATYDVPSGSYVVTTKQTGHKDMPYSLKVQPSMNGQTIDLPAPLPIYGVLEVAVTPANATIYIDGKKVGETPMTLPKVLIGAHQIKITKEGYADKNETIVIKEKETYALSGTMNKQVIAPAVNTVSQPVVSSSPATLSVSPTSISAPIGGKTVYLTVSSNRYWEIKYPSGTMYTATKQGSQVQVVINKNSGASRSDFFYVKTSDGSKEVKINLSQSGSGVNLNNSGYSNTYRNRSSAYKDFRNTNGIFEIYWFGLKGCIGSGIELPMYAFSMRIGPVRINPCEFSLGFSFGGEKLIAYQASMDFYIPWNDSWAVYFGAGPSINLLYSSKNYYYDMSSLPIWFKVEAGVHFHWGTLCSSEFFFRYDGMYSIGTSFNLGTGF